MPGVIDQSKVERDIDDIRKTVNEDVIVSPRSGLDYESLPMLARRLSENGMFKPFVTETKLLAYIPEVIPTAAKALDTKKVWIYEQTSAEGIEPKTFAWHDTGLSELDQAISHTDKMASLKNSFYKILDLVDANNIPVLSILKDKSVWIPNLKKDMKNGIRY